MVASIGRRGPPGLESIGRLENSGTVSGIVTGTRRPAIHRDRRPVRTSYGEAARPTPSHTTKALTRRAFLKGSSLLAVSGLAFLAAPHRAFAAKPGYNRYNNAVGDFATHVREIESGGRNVAGSDYAFAHGIPVAAPIGGRVAYVQDFKNGTAGKTVVIEYGIVDVQIAHLERLFVGRGDALDRSTCIGTQGKNSAVGGKAAVSHLHISVYGCGAFYDYRQVPPGGNRHRAFYLLNPDALTPRRDPREILTDCPWDGEADHDTPYLDYVDTHVRGGLERLVRDFPDHELARFIGRSLKSRSLAETLRRVWIKHERRADDALTRRFEGIFAHVREAGRLLTLTSPYFDHTNPRTILKVADANPEPARSLILDPRFYGRYVPRGAAPQA